MACWFFIVLLEFNFEVAAAHEDFNAPIYY